MKKVLILIFCLIGISGSNFAQKILSFKGIKGEYIIDSKADISIKTGTERAVNEAKLEALRRAGVTENINASDVMTSTETNSKFKEEMNSFVSVEINGAVLNDSIIEQKSFTNEFGNIVAQVIINVDVIKYETRSETSFDFKVEGVKEYYENDDLMHFSFLPYSEGFLKVFNVNDGESFIVYPFSSKEYPFLNDTINRKFKPNVMVDFPVNKLMGNPATKQVGYMLSTEAERERNYLIFVYTKENTPFKGNLNYKSVLNWIYRLSPDKRKVQFFDFVIVNKKAGN